MPAAGRHLVGMDGGWASLVELLGAGAVLIATVAAGTVAHELSHAVALRAAGVPHELRWLPDRRDEGLLRAGISGGWASVRLLEVPEELSPWSIRAAALAPLSLTTPFALVPLGVIPGPLRGGDPVVIAVAVGWLACALPSPQDFSLVWYAEQVIGRDGAEDGS